MRSPAVCSPIDPWMWQPPQPCRWEEPVSLIRLDGPDTRRFLHGQTSQDLERAGPGQVLATCCLSPTGRLRGLAEVLVDGTGAWLVITAGDGPALHQALDRVLFPADQVRLAPVQPARLIHLLGIETIGAGGAPPPAGGWQPAGGGGENGPEGWWLATPLRLLLRGPEGPLPPGLENIPALAAPDAERWRIQRGRPAAAGEISDEVNPFELGLAGRVSLSKGCYVGQETLAKLATYDGVKQQLRRWHWRAPAGAVGGTDRAAAALQPGSPLVSAEGARAGRITSCLPWPAEPGEPALWLGLALVRRQALGAETLLSGSGDGEPEEICLSVPDEVTPPPVGAGGGSP